MKSHLLKGKAHLHKMKTHLLKINEIKQLHYVINMYKGVQTVVDGGPPFLIKHTKKTITSWRSKCQYVFHKMKLQDITRILYPHFTNHILDGTLKFGLELGTSNL